ncbi:hypothetical protein Dimus_008149 [Dionaea muscipula]
MKLPTLSPSKLLVDHRHPFNSLRFLVPKSKSLSFCPQQLSPSPPSKPSWNSNPTFTITNPLLQLLEQCTMMSQLKQIQAHMTRIGLFFHIFPVSRIVSFCALSPSGDIRYANLVFNQIPHPNVYIWNTMIRGYCKTQNPVVGFGLFCEMVRESADMDSRSFVFALKACGLFMGVREGKSVHCRAWKMGFDSKSLVRNGLIHFYSVSGDLECARKLFDACSERDVVTWTTMIVGYVQQNDHDEAVRVFDAMVLHDVAPNEITMIAMLSACAHKRDLDLGKSMCKYVEKKNVDCSLNLMNAIMDMYVKCGCLMTAREFFDEMDWKDVFSWTIMIDGYAKGGKLSLARSLFDEAPVKNIVCWNAMIAGYSQNNRPNEAIRLFRDMVGVGLVPIEATLVCVLSACAQSGSLDMGRWIHHYYAHQSLIKSSIVLSNALIDMYAKCGCIYTAESLFNEMPERDLVSWNSMIVGFADHGHESKALMLFENMKDLGINPDGITFIGVLSACSHGGLVTKGRSYFSDMEKIFGLEPKVEHYACMIDLLGRAGLIAEAYELIEKMPMEPDEAAWGALLNACRMHGNAELGKLAAFKLIDIDPGDSGSYALLANLCAAKKLWSDVISVRSMMKEKGIKKTPGHSSIEVEGELHEFSVADKSHPRYKDVYRVLDEIVLQSILVQDVGYESG